MNVQLSKITKRFGSTVAVKDLTLTLPEQGTVAIMGPSGCGKTTLLQMLAGLQRPNQGMLKCTASSIAYVFQEPRLLPWRTVEDNIKLARNQKTPPSKTAAQWLEAVGLGDCAARYPDELSGGMRQRVAIARALYCESDLLLMDEPFRGLDEATRAKVMELVRNERNAPGKLTLLVTHDKAEALALADSVLLFTEAPASSYTWEQITH
jgi:NitT/TauT family transport system ATP-binding protein